MGVLRGLFVLEGIDGSGKTTLSRTLATAVSNGIYEMQPSYGPTGQKIRSILKEKDTFPSEELLDLFIQDRQEHQSRLLELSQSHQRIILDRYVLSTMAYQGLNFSKEFLWERNKDFFIPQITFFLNTPLDMALHRIQSRDGGLEFYEATDLQKRILSNYQLAIPFLEDKGYNIVKLNGSKDLDTLVSDCLKHIKESEDEME